MPIDLEMRNFRDIDEAFYATAAAIALSDSKTHLLGYCCSIEEPYRGSQYDKSTDLDYSVSLKWLTSAGEFQKADLTTRKYADLPILDFHLIRNGDELFSMAHFGSLYLEWLPRYVSLLGGISFIMAGRWELSPGPLAITAARIGLETTDFGDLNAPKEVITYPRMGTSEISDALGYGK